MSREVPRIRIWDELGKQTGILTVYEAFEGQISETCSKMDNMIKQATLMHRNVVVVEEDGSLKRSSNKRALSDVDADFIKELNSPSYSPSNYSDRYPGDWSAITGFEEKARARARSDSPKGHFAHSTIENAAAMSGESSGSWKRRRRNHSQSLISAREFTGAPAATRTPLVVVEDSDNSYENEGLVVAAKRVRPNTSRKLKQHNSGHNALNTPRDEPSAHAYGNAQEQPHEYKDAPKQRLEWSPAAQYLPNYNSLANLKNRSPSPTDSAFSEQAHPGPPLEEQPAVPIDPPKGRRMKRPSGGITPTNTLNRGSNTSQILPRQTFDLHENNKYSRKPADNPNKRQKLEHEVAVTPSLSKEVIDVDSEVGYGHKHRELSDARSGQTRTQYGRSASNGSWNGVGVQEYQNVENTVRVRADRSALRKKIKGEQRGTSSMDPPTANSRGNKQLPKTNGMTVVSLGDAHNGEDPNDLISDVEIVSSWPMKNSTPQVVIGSYQGSAFRAPPRTKIRRSNISTDPALRSKHFPAGHLEQEKHVIPGPISTRETEPARKRSRMLKMQGTDVNTKSIAQPSVDLYESDHSPDDLTTGHCFNDEQADWDQAQALLKRPKAGKSQHAARKRPRDTEAHSDISEDDLSLVRNADIKPADFHTSKKSSQKKRSREESYDVVQLFSETETWLLPGSDAHWSLSYNPFSERLSVFASDGNLQFDLSIKTIAKIEVNNDSAKLVFHNSRDMTDSGKGSHIYLELRDKDKSLSLRDSLESKDVTIKIIQKSGDYLDKVFLNNQKQSKLTKRLSPPQEVPDDIRLIQKKAAARIQDRFDKAIGDKKSGRGPRVIDKMDKDDLDLHTETRGVTRTNRTRSSIDLQNEPGRPSKFEPASFYSDSKTTPPTFQHGTRSSTRLTNRDSVNRQSPPQRSPSPERWTELHPDWAKSWKSSIIYPRTGKNRATVDKRDIERLDEGQFLNDNLIFFYLLWLEQQLIQRSPDVANRIYFHNTFFYERLTTIERGQRGINYEAVQRWTSRVDLLAFDYIIVPVNEHTHWYVAIICNAPKLLGSDPRNLEHSQTHRNEGNCAQRTVAEVTPKSPPLADVSQTKVEESLKTMSLQDQIPEDRDDGESAKRSSSPVDLVPSSVQVLNPGHGSVNQSDGQESLTSPTVKISSDLTEHKSTPPKKGKRKSSAPAPRKYDPKEPRIITLDSLGLRHSPTCTNLRDYLVAEIKAKHGVDIPPPGSLGTTAQGIPHQDNYCDCGLFLLSYIEKFLEQPDKFIHDLLQDGLGKETKWQQASDLRDKIRDLLFGLQKQQVADAEEVKLAKSKAKRDNKLEKKQHSPVTAKAESHEAPNSIRKSSTPKRASLQRESPSVMTEPTSLEPTENTTSIQPKGPVREPKELVHEHTVSNHVHLDDSLGMSQEAAASMKVRKSYREDQEGRPLASGQGAKLEHDKLKIASSEKVKGKRKAPHHVQEGSNATTNRSLSLFESLGSTVSGIIGKITSKPDESRMNAFEIQNSPQSSPTVPFQSAEANSRDKVLLRSPSPEQSEQSLSSVRERRPTPFPNLQNHHAGPLYDDAHDEKPPTDLASWNFDNVEIPDGPFRTIPQTEDDEEMLLPNHDPNIRDVQSPGPRELSSPQLSSSAPATPIAKERAKPKFSSVPANLQKRKYKGHIQDDHGSRAFGPYGGDASDDAVLGMRKPTHIHFLE